MKKCFWEFKKARDYVRELGLKNKKQWKEYCKNNRPEFLPSNPNAVYKEWNGFPYWMGYDWDVHCNKKYSVNEDFFKTWSCNMSYVLGFWFADGYITNGLARDKRTRFIFGITQCEKYILEDILKVMDADYPIHEEKKKIGATSYRFFIESKEIVDDVIKLGGGYRKSLVSKFPDVPKEYLPDFIRGLWDGDGSAFKDKKKRATATFTCGSKYFVDSFVEVLKSNVGIENPLVIRDKRRKSAFSISLSPNSSRKLRDYMYNDCNLFLKRKKDIFDSFGGFVLSSSNIKENFLSFQDANKFVIGLGFNRQWHWREFCKIGKRPFYIPSNPSKTYIGIGWKNWRHFLTGKER